MFADLTLARRLERAEGANNALAVEARARLSPDSGATWTEIAGAYAMFDGAASPLTQTFGLGLFETPAASHLDAIETFYAERRAPVHHEVSPIADASLLPLLTSRGYRPIELTSVLYREVGEVARAGQVGQIGHVGHEGASGITVRTVGADDVGLYARTAAEGWRDSGFADFVRANARVSAATDGVTLFLAELDGAAIAAAALAIHDGVANLAGASTIPDGRGRGAQNALVDYRLRFAAARGCDLAFMGALPGSGSQRNAERNGFRIAYTRIKWRK